METKRYIHNIDLSKQEARNVALQKLPSDPANPVIGQIYWNTTDETAYAYTGGFWLDLGNIYQHPTYQAINPNLSGANVLASLEVNGQGHVISASTRMLTMNDLGYTGDLDANKYIHDTFTGNDLGSPLTGAEVISDINVNNEGHVTGFETRNITASDVGAAVINDSVISAASTYSSQKIEERLGDIEGLVTGALIYQTVYNATTNTPDLENPTAGTIKQGYVYVVSSSGTFFTEEVSNGDMLIAETDDPTQLSDWARIEKNIPDIVDATDTNKGIIRIATQSEVNAGVVSDAAVVPSTLVAFYNARRSSEGYAINIGDGTSTSYDISHGIGTKDVLVQSFDDATGDPVGVIARRVDVNTVRILVNVALTNNELRIVISSK